MEQVIATADESAGSARDSGSLEGWQHGGKWFCYGGHAIFSRMAGQGEPLVLIHGFPTASWDWSRVWPMLTQEHNVLTLDMLGFGFSDKPVDYAYSIEDQADLFQGWIEGLGLSSVHLLVHDYGCSVAQELLAREQEGALPFAIASVCFLNGALFPEVHNPLLIQKLLSSPFGGLISRGLTRRSFERNFRRLFGSQNPPDRQDLEDFWYLLTYNNGRGILHRLIHFMEERRCHRHRWVGALQRAQQPIRLISGTADPVSGAGMARRYRELVSNADVVSLRNVGHYPHFECPWDVFSAYRDFRKRIAPTSDE
ncbi:MAG: alpha/beta hydrolase [Gammaproteobacteria bacterium]|uniref:Alpha/beta hydrolase fold protein n=1 Tax=Marinobacter nitratireducens TaxID=1137280 RepID=A0A072N6D2_9GAMM|nr:alpha/beta hydrolase [Marinobacter nitratireducens]KEF33061.1 alpha/beta hydrolase fold protein [Marinobacter nitratireducens]TNE77487.1 MAG: alpha/beta hydrolase [Gammaproteobacteria bacterium]TNE96536.1 MAG: alpha/beta hydrolase [Gammaproteobacteria bacterium]